ncbi:MAG TPA: hypothetical protein VKH65_02190 [Myxococcales bacterium]|nr:hypothetical protein [Myxococcales bacterium]
MRCQGEVRERAGLVRWPVAAGRPVLVRMGRCGAERFFHGASDRLGVARPALALEGEPEEPVDGRAAGQSALAHVQLGVQHGRRCQAEGGHRGSEYGPALAGGSGHARLPSLARTQVRKPGRG